MKDEKKRTKELKERENGSERGRSFTESLDEIMAKHEREVAAGAARIFASSNTSGAPTTGVTTSTGSLGFDDEELSPEDCQLLRDAGLDVARPEFDASKKIK